MKRRRIFNAYILAIFFAHSILLPGRIAWAQPKDVAGMRSQALMFYREGRYEEAITLYKKIIAAKPKDIDLLKDLMWVLWKSERFEEAGKVASEVMNLSKKDAEAKSIIEKAPPLALRSKANAHFHAGRYEAANNIYKQLADLEPKNPSILRDYMWSLWELERYEESRAVAARILTINKNDAEAREMLRRAPMASLRANAVESYRVGRYDDAVSSYKKLLEQSPKNPGLLKDLFWSLWQSGKYDQVIPIATQLTVLAPNDPETWNMMGRAYVVNERLEEGLKAYNKSLLLKPRQPDTERVIGRLHVDLREFDTAIDILNDLEKKDPSIRTLYPQKAKALFFKGRFAESAAAWSKAIEFYPDNDNYRVHEARALYYNGQIPRALDRLKKLAAGSGTMKWMSIDFLVDDALSHRDFATAIELLEKNLPADITPQDEPRLLKLTTIYFAQKKYRAGLQTMNRYLKYNSASIPALVSKGDALLEYGRYSEAARVFKKVLALNPYAIRGYDGLANAELANGRPAHAVKAFIPALQLDPTNPYLILQGAHYFSASGNNKESREILLRWLKKNSGPTLPILLYHGITPFSRDPNLAYPVHLRLENFEDQIRALKSAGYTPVTTDQVLAWYKKNEPMPKKPILITFDDGRLDSFRFADPVLKKYNMKATMFTPVANAEGTLPPAYLSWSQIQQYQSTGRWEFQAHGDDGHTRIKNDSKGRQGLFLINRMWLEKENRLETLAEWKRRVQSDHETSKQKMAARLGKTPHSFAYPEGTYGQIDTINSPQAATINLEAAKKSFQLAFIQDRFGINVRSRDPMLLNRIEPKQDWTGDDLIKHLQDNTPFVLMYRRLIRQAVWENKPQEAITYLAELKDAGASQLVLLGEEGRIRSALGDYRAGRSNVEEALRLGKDRDNEQLLKSLNLQSRPHWVPGFTFTEDNRDRKNSIFEQTFRPFPTAPLNVGLDYLHGVFKERDVEDVKEDGLGLNMLIKPSPFHDFTARGMWHWFDDQIRDTYTASLDINSRWNDHFETEVEGGRSVYDTARAMRADVTEDYATATALWKQEGSWRLSAKLQGANLSDDNRRAGTQLGASYQFVSSLRAIYKFTMDHMKNISPNYYSPQHLRQHQVGISFTRKYEWFEPSLTYLPGYGDETGVDSEFIQDFEAALNIRLGARTVLQPYYSHSKTPTYWRNTFNLILSHRF